MAKVEQQQQMSRTLVLGSVPFMVVILIAVHVLALVYWIYKLATQKQQLHRSKAH